MAGLMAEPEIRYCTTAGGVSIAYYTMGDGHPLVVTSSVAWSHLRLQLSLREYHRSRSGEGLGRGLQVVRYDARGTGLSDRHSFDFSMDARLLDIEAVVERLKLRRFAIFGSVHGTPAAIAYAAGHPERVSHLILESAYARGRDHRETMADILMRDEGWERFTLSQANWALDFSDSESARRLASLFRESMTPESHRAFVAAMDAIDVTSLLPRIVVPTLVMYRSRSSDVSLLGWSRELASKIPDARYVEVTKRDDPRWTEEETRIVEDFLGIRREVGGTSTPGPTTRATGRNVVTILFTDLASSTALTQRLGDAKAQELVRAHNAIVREALTAHGGSEIKHTGDGIMASFPTASGALECAIAIQRAVVASSPPPVGEGPGEGSELAIHIGLNAGEPVAEESDLFGTSVQLARRICDHAQAGQILVSNVVRELAAGKGFLFADIGEVVAKGFEEPVRLYEVRWRGEV